LFKIDNYLFICVSNPPLTPPRRGIRPLSSFRYNILASELELMSLFVFSL